MDRGAGLDVCNGNDGDDTFLAQDDEADAATVATSRTGFGRRRARGPAGRRRPRRRRRQRLLLRRRRNDDPTGGTGADSFAGSGGDDVLPAVDGEADAQLSRGAGVDTAQDDAGIDPAPVAVENRVPE